MPVHATAIVDPRAEVDATCDVGPFCVVGAGVKIGPRSRLLSHVVVQNHTTLGADNVLYPFSVLGAAPQDLKYQGEPTRLVIGDGNVVRESATLNIGTASGRGETRVGSGNLFMAYAHVAHDCVVGDHVVLANWAGLAGHVEVGDHAVFGGLAGVHQFCRVGRHAFIAGGAKVVQDVPPFCVAQGDRAVLMGINVVGLKRAGWDRERLRAVRQAFGELFLSEGTRLTALEAVEAGLGRSSKDVAEVVAFIRGASRGVCRPRPNPGGNGF